MISALYEGELRHARWAPLTHRFRHRLAFLVIDLDELPALSSGLRLFAHNRPAPFALHDADYAAGSTRGLWGSVLESLSAAGIDLGEGGRVLLLTQVRVLGYVFNPVSFFYCLDRSGALRAVIAEVNNTWGRTHRYVLDDPARVPAARGASFEADKALHVSPFMGMDTRYRFHFLPERPPSEDGAPLEVRMEVLAGDPNAGPFFEARLLGRRRALSDAALARTLVRHPLSTLQIIGRIHLEALRLRLAGAPLFPRRADGSPAPEAWPAGARY